MRPSRRNLKATPISRRPRLARLRRWSFRLAALILAVALTSILSGYELVWARGHTAAVFSRGGVSCYRSTAENVYCFRRTSTAGDGKPIPWEPTILDGISGRTLSTLSWVTPSDRAQIPEYCPDGFAINGVPSMEPQAEMFTPRSGLWRTRVPLWWAAAAALVPWCVASMWLGLRLPLARRALYHRHHCGCGYPSTGLPAAAPCPECGLRTRAAEL